VGGQPQLLQVVDALGPPRGLAGRLDGWQEEGDQDRDDGDNDEKFDERKRPPRAYGYTHGTTPEKNEDWWRGPQCQLRRTGLFFGDFLTDGGSLLNVADSSGGQNAEARWHKP